MAFERRTDGSDPVRPEPIRHVELRRRSSTQVLAVGTLACPACDAPLAPDPDGMSPSARVECGFCRHAAAVRDCLSLGVPTRPTRVQVRVALPGRRGRAIVSPSPVRA